MGEQRLQMSDWKEIARDLGRSVNSVFKAHRKLTDPRYAFERAPVRHKRGVMRTMMKAAMDLMGGEATVPELVSCCRTNAELQKRFGAQLSTHVTKVSGALASMPMWERCIHTNMKNVFDCASRKRDGRKVYKSRSA